MFNQITCPNLSISGSASAKPDIFMGGQRSRPAHINSDCNICVSPYIQHFHIDCRPPEAINPLVNTEDPTEKASSAAPDLMPTSTFSSAVTSSAKAKVGKLCAFEWMEKPPRNFISGEKFFIRERFLLPCTFLILEFTLLKRVTLWDLGHIFSFFATLPGN